MGCILKTLGIMTLMGILLFSSCLYCAGKAIKLPEYAKKEVVLKREALLMERLSSAVNDSKTVDEFAAKVKEKELPENVLYIGMKRQKKWEKKDVPMMIDIYSKIPSPETHSRKIWGGVGVATLKSGQNVIVIEKDLFFPQVDSYVIYLEDTFSKTPSLSMENPFDYHVVSLKGVIPLFEDDVYKMFEEECRIGNQLLCYRLKNLNMAVSWDSDKPESKDRKQCENKDAQSCLSVAFLEFSKGSKKEGGIFTEKACEYGITEACEYLKTHSLFLSDRTK